MVVGLARGGGPRPVRGRCARRQRARTGGIAHTACGRASNAEGGPARAAAPAPARKARAVRTRPRTGSRRLVTGGPSAGGRGGIGAGEVGYADGRLVAVP